MTSRSPSTLERPDAPELAELPPSPPWSALTGGLAAAAVAAQHADEVDRDGRFPVEALAALKSAGLLSAGFPVELGGAGVGIRELSVVARALGGACSSTGMVFAMHQSQALILARHAAGTPIEAHVRRIVAQQLLLASATTEITTSGDIGRSTCHVELTGEHGDRARVQKNAPVISYGEHADVVCITARRGPDAPGTDQVLVVAPRADVEMTPTIPWNVIGFRGTCSPGYLLDATTDASNVMADDYATISAQTVLPTAHILWASVWLGMADAALDKARAEVRKAARRTPGTTPPQALRLTDLVLEHQRFEADVSDAVARYEAYLASGGDEPSVGFTIAMNNLKRVTATAVVTVVTGALEICGINGYREDHPASMGRLLRDAFGPQLMVANDRIRTNTSEMILAYRR